MISSPGGAINAVIASTVANNNAMAALRLIDDDDDPPPTFFMVIYAVVIAFVYAGYTYLMITMTYDAFTDTSFYDKIGALDYLMLAFTILLLIPWVVLPIWGIVHAVKWITSKSKKQHINMKETIKASEDSCNVKEKSSYHETRIKVSARILEIRIVVQHKARRVNDIPVSDYKRKYLVTLGYAGVKSTVTGFRRCKELKKGDKIEAMLVSRHYQNGKTIRKLIIQ